MHLKSAEYVHSASKPSQFLKRPIPHFVFAGRSNVGKSSLLNTLLKRKQLAHTSKKPGKTRLINYFLINDRFYFVDLPGYGFAQVSMQEQKQWGQLIEQYLKGTTFIACVFVLMDIRHEPSAQDRQMIEWLNHFQLPYILILTKADKLSKSQSIRQRTQFARTFELEADSVMVTSAAKSSGTGDLASVIEKILPLAVDEINRTKESSKC